MTLMIIVIAENKSEPINLIVFIVERKRLPQLLEWIEIESQLFTLILYCSPNKTFDKLLLHNSIVA